MLVDGYSKEEIKEILDTTIQQHYDQEMASAGIYRTMAKLAPAFGIIGTLIGLIGMMQSLEGDMASLGPSMATALTTTLLRRAPVQHDLPAHRHQGGKTHRGAGHSHERHPGRHFVHIRQDPGGHRPGQAQGLPPAQAVGLHQGLTRAALKDLTRTD